MNWIKHYDEETGIEQNLPQLDDGSKDSVEDVIRNNADIIYNMMYSGLELAIINKLPRVATVAIQDIIFHIDKDQYKSKLELCLEYFQSPELEEYEKCATIVKLLKLL